MADLVGPREYRFDELLRGYLESTGRRRPTVPVWIPGRTGRAYRAGQNLTLAGADRGSRTGEDVLDGRFAVKSAPMR